MVGWAGELVGQAGWWVGSVGGLVGLWVGCVGNNDNNNNNDNNSHNDNDSGLVVWLVGEWMGS